MTQKNIPILLLYINLHHDLVDTVRIINPYLRIILSCMELCTVNIEVQIAVVAKKIILRECFLLQLNKLALALCLQISISPSISCNLYRLSPNLLGILYLYQILLDQILNPLFLLNPNEEFFHVLLIPRVHAQSLVESAIFPVIPI